VVVKLAELVLTLNAFEFNGAYYQQVSGVAMGTKMGPAYADLFMVYLETALFAKGNIPFPNIYKRYRDDIFIFSKQEKTVLEPFMLEMNRMHPNIIIEFSVGNGLPFLDTLVTAKNESLHTSIYYKPTDSHSYLLYTSHHPMSTKNAIPYSQFLRLRRICSDDEDFRKQCELMKGFLKAKLYPERVIDMGMLRALETPRELSLQKRKKDGKTPLPLVLTFTETAKCVATNTRDLYMSVVSNDPELSEILPTKPVTAYRKQKSLRDLLVKASLRGSRISKTLPIQIQDAVTIPCNKGRCKTCQHSIKRSKITGPNGFHKIYDQFSCKSKCVIYAIMCSKCPAIYIGQTSRCLHERFREHLYNVSTENIQTSVVEHFTKIHTKADMVVTAIQKAPNDLERRLEMEARIIFKLGTLNSPGLNTDFKLI
jgi:hypothetical protein